ncbi:helix-turn-helix domain-containing protein [Gluconobacter cerinus]|uniref:helix-turn-helix domain-containing protein n=1 Tax=Gluconobacter cerinus TaxID=38307 RepID=UPI001C047699|nr:helix-turn-helix transcriptional regulator [Gluconobacter cerinus]
MSIGARIRAARKKEKLGQADLAAELGVSTPTISEWENNKKTPSPERRAAIAKALNAKESELFEKIEERYPPILIDPVDLSHHFGGMLGGILGLIDVVEEINGKLVIQLNDHFNGHIPEDVDISLKLLETMRKYIKGRTEAYRHDFDLLLKEGGLDDARRQIPNPKKNK